MWSSRIDTVDRGSVFLVEENSMEVNFEAWREGEGSKPVGSPSLCPHSYQPHWEEPTTSLFTYFELISST